MKTGTLSKLSVLALGAALLSFAAFNATVGASQSRAQNSIITQLLWQSLLQCYDGPTERVAADDEVQLQVELNGNGDMMNLPDILTPAKLTPGERALLREGTVALINCTPFISDGGDKSIYGTFDMVLTREGLLLKNVEAFVGVAEVIPELDALEVVTEQPDVIEEAPASVSTGDAITAETEAELGLTRSDRREVQRRLTLLDYNTKGVDGVFGKGSRAAIAAWQSDNQLPTSGFLDLNQIGQLREMSQEAYVVWDNRPKRYTDRNGCLREPNGVIIQGRSFSCDLAAASQSLGLSR